LSVLVGNGDINEISSRNFVMQRIATQDRVVFDNYLAARNEVAKVKQQADVLVRRVSGLLADQRGQQGSLKDARQRKNGYLKELQQKQGELQEMLAQFAQDEATITNQIQSYMRRRTTTRGGKREALPPYKGGRFPYPVAGHLSSNFGMRYHPILHITRMHSGCDFGAPIGTSIHCVADGEVIHSSYMRGYGNVVIVDHGGGLSTVYAHCSRINVNDGQRVRRGQVLGAVGNTGLSTGPHLHFEVRVNGRPVNPIKYL
jgi:murein DD-endopeptidase MepM/ murein hydrolase activator NlpD